MELKRDEIIKALEYCHALDECYNCPYTCLNTHLKRDAISLIKELTEESQKWQEGYDCVDAACRELSSKCDELTATNESLEAAIVALKEECEVQGEELKRAKSTRYMAHPDGRLEMIPTADTIIHTFAERLKRYYDDKEHYLGYSIAYNIDIVAERLLQQLAPTCTNLHQLTPADNKCVACGDIIPEGRQVCPGCEGGKYEKG